MDSTDVRRQWAERTGEYSPAYYAHYGPDETSEAIRQVLDSRLTREAAVLELGCSSGRHLAHLFDHGFTDLSGVELNGAAFEVMAESYPALAEQGRFYHDAIEAVVGAFADDQFDVVFSVETLQHIHPEEAWVFAELARITDALLITVENESEATGDVNYVNDEFPLYYRDWNRVFTDLGFEPVAVGSDTRDTIRTFRAR